MQPILIVRHFTQDDVNHCIGEGRGWGAFTCNYQLLRQLMLSRFYYYSSLSKKNKAVPIDLGIRYSKVIM